jgi:hypothetical protein
MCGVRVHRYVTQKTLDNHPSQSEIIICSHSARAASDSHCYLTHSDSGFITLSYCGSVVLMGCDTVQTFRASEPMARVPKLARVKIFLARGIH